MAEKCLGSEIKDRIPHNGDWSVRQRDVKALSYRRKSISKEEKIGKKEGYICKNRSLENIVVTQ